MTAFETVVGYWPPLALFGFVAVYAALSFLVPRVMNGFEENFIAFLLAVLTITAFSQVLARYLFQSGWTGALEFQRILFAWLILFGMSYGIRVGTHLGVDVLIRMLPKPLFRAFAVFGALCCIAYAALLLEADAFKPIGVNSAGGAIDYWARFFKLGLGLDDLRYPVYLQETYGLQERVQRWIAYLMLPVGLGLFLFRSIEGMVQILTGRRELLVASHEAEELVAEHRDVLKDDGPTTAGAGTPAGPRGR
jgi:C4-dicarboxylate transporter DctQ subunit